jgi:hypothetical protein
MRVKLSVQYQTEREDICKRLIEILELDEDHSFVVHDLDMDTDKQNKILDMKDEIKKCFAVSDLTAFKPNFECKKPYLTIIRSILRKQNYQLVRSQIQRGVGDGLFVRLVKYRVFRES